MTRYAFPGFAAGPQGGVPAASDLGASTISPAGCAVYDTAMRGEGPYGIRIVSRAGAQAIVVILAPASDAKRSFGINQTITIPPEPDLRAMAHIQVRQISATTGGTAGPSATIQVNPDGDIVVYEAGTTPRSWPLLLHTAPGWNLGGKYRIKGWFTSDASSATAGTVNLTIQAVGSSTVLGTLVQAEVNMTTGLLYGLSLGFVSSNNDAGHVAGFGVPVFETGLAAAPADYVPSTAAPSVNPGASQYPEAGAVLALTGASATAGQGTIASTAWTCTAKPDGAANPTINNASSLTNATVTGLVPGRYRFRLTVTDSASSGFSEVTEYVHPASGENVGVYQEMASGWSNQGGAASLAAAYNDTNAATYGESPAGPTGQECPIVMNPFGPGAISITVSGYESGGDILRQVKIYKEDGQTLVYADPQYQLTTTDADHAITLSAEALALIPTLSDRRALVVKIADTAL